MPCTDHDKTQANRPLPAKEVAYRLGIALSTLNMWLATDQARVPESRLFSFHSYCGRKRIWSQEAFAQLKAAIERESEPGGALGGWRTHNAPVAAPIPRAEAALRDVLNYRVGRNSLDGDRDRPAARNADRRRSGP